MNSPMNDSASQPLSDGEAAARIAELEQFITILVHDLKSPLVTVSGFAHLLRNYVRKQDTAQILDAADRIELGTRRLSSMLDGLSEFADLSRDPLDPGEVDLGAVFEQILAGMQTRLAVRGVQVRQPDVYPRIWADSRRLTLALHHMLRNAIEHGCRDRAVDVSITADVASDSVRIAVHDSGGGIPPEFRDRIFRLFQRFHPQATGAGIGLAIVRRVAQLHRGGAQVTHPETGGLSVVLELPTIRVRG